MKKKLTRSIVTASLLLMTLTTTIVPARVSSAPKIKEETLQPMKIQSYSDQDYSNIETNILMIEYGKTIPIVVYADIDYVELEVPANSDFKSYMSYKAITSRNSNQYKLQGKAKTNSKGIRCVGNRYMIALGSYYCSKIGTKIDVILESGVVLECILGDVKDDAHTDDMGQQQLYDKSVVEFIVDTDKITEMASKLGDLSCYTNFEGNVETIRIYE